MMKRGRYVLNLAVITPSDRSFTIFTFFARVSVSTYRLILIRIKIKFSQVGPDEDI